jgi:hypothetical protein
MRSNVLPAPGTVLTYLALARALAVDSGYGSASKL